MKRKLLKIMLGLVSVYGLALAGIYFFQEKLLFHPNVLPHNFQFDFYTPFEEVYIPVEKNVKIHGILFHAAQKSKGVILYFHGNGGSVNSWAPAAEVFNDAGYDIYISDYRGYGKSSGEITSESQLCSDADSIYSYFASKYDPKAIVIAGYSIGTGLASYLASTRECKALILEAPYSSLSALADEKLPLLPEWVKKYKFRSDLTIEKVTCPVYIFHGTADQLIPYRHSEVLIKHSPKAHLYALPGLGHNAINESDLFRTELSQILAGL